MKKMLATLLFMPMIAFSQTDSIEKEKFIAYCSTINELDEMLSKYGELPALRGKSVRIENGEVENSIVIFMNAESKTWTIVEKISSRKYCVVAVGHNFQPVPNDVIENLIKERQNSGT
jgi:hypothetical protein